MPDPIELRIEKLVYGGDGLGHHEGHTVFVPFVLPAETVAVEPLERRKKFIRGQASRGSPSHPQTARLLAACTSGTCGGLQLPAHPLRAAASLQKRHSARNALPPRPHCLGRPDRPACIAASSTIANRAQWKIASGSGAAPEIGYFEAGSQNLCAVRECPILSPRLAEVLASLSRLLASGKLPGDLREVEVLADAKDCKLLFNLSFDRLAGSYESIAEMLRATIPQVETILFHDRRADRFELAGPGHISYRVGDHSYRVGHLSFFQINRFLLPDLAATRPRRRQGPPGPGPVCGRGPVYGAAGAPFRASHRRGVERGCAARIAATNLQDSGASSPAFREAGVEGFLARWQEKPDFVVLDPPRAGVSATALARLNKLAPQTIAYLSCDPATLARDLAFLVGSAEKPGAYLISEVHLVDIFPQTYHMEVLVRLSRRA